jgi:hypothetical protein
VAQNYEQLRTAAADYSAVKSMYVTYGAALRGSLDPTVWGSNPYADDPAATGSRSRATRSSQTASSPSSGSCQPKRVRYARARFRCTDPVAKLVVHRVGLGVRPATHQR